MRAFVNELALVEACQTAIPSQNPFLLLLRDRQEYRLIRQNLYCSRSMGNQLVDGQPLRNFMMQLPRDKRQALLIWIDHKGPYFDDDLLGNDSDLFIWNDKEVNNVCLGEAAANIRIGNPVSVFSRGIQKGSLFDSDSFSVLHASDGHQDIVLIIDNYCDPDCLNAALERQQPSATNWHEMIETCRRFERLRVSDECLDLLAPHPFSSNIAEKAILMLQVLDDMLAKRGTDGNWLPEAREIYETYFKGYAPRFSDESERNKKDFVNEMTFRDPFDGGTLTCFWHGKIKERQFRIHFSWPPAQNEKFIKILYIGPKISKR